MESFTNLNPIELLKPLEKLENCSICPRKCYADRFSDNLGYCNTNAGFNIASICIHRGEEPVLGGEKGICNIFFSHCNMQCIYCQNFQISKNDSLMLSMELSEVLDKIIVILDSGCNTIGFVSPSHQIIQMKIIIDAIRQSGRNPIIVMNTNAYDDVNTINGLENYVDIYLPDFKYSSHELAGLYSDAPDYPEIALKSIKEMYRQKGSSLRVNDNGYAESGLIIRHLVLPGHSQNSIDILRKIAEEISTSINISLMSQFYPSENLQNYPELNSTITIDEYIKVQDEMELLGFYKGWIQEQESSGNYQPDFDKEHPFEYSF